MTNFLDAAVQVLGEQDQPLSAAEITRLALERGHIKTRGRTPAQTMKSKLSQDILRYRSRSRFMRTAPAMFALREWETRGMREYSAPRFEKSLLDEEILVIPAAELSQVLKGPGPLFGPAISGQALAALARPWQRHEAEENDALVQLVSVFILRFEDAVLTFKRSRRLPEHRLHGVWSLFFGGHLNPDDLPTLFNVFDADLHLMFLSRELEEELRLPRDTSVSSRFEGLIYDESVPVSRQHLGIVYSVELSSPEYVVGERGFLLESRFESLQDVAGRIEDFENWSEILLGMLRTRGVQP